eukprot:8948560-Alexandrium_andersonii.AAC.1
MGRCRLYIRDASDGSHQPKTRGGLGTAAPDPPARGTTHQYGHNSARPDGARPGRSSAPARPLEASEEPGEQEPGEQIAPGSQASRAPGRGQACHVAYL